MYLSYHTYSYIDYITMHILNKFSLDNDLILVHQKLCHKLITLEDFINLHKTKPFYQIRWSVALNGSIVGGIKFIIKKKGKIM